MFNRKSTESSPTVGGGENGGREAAFERQVERVLASLPPPFAAALDEVRIELAVEPTPAQLRRAGVGSGHTLLGLYEGVPQTGRSVEQSGTMPEVVWLFRGPIERQCRTAEQFAEQVRTTLLHELGHHFGMSERDLADVGYD